MYSFAQSVKMLDAFCGHLERRRESFGMIVRLKRKTIFLRDEANGNFVFLFNGPRERLRNFAT